MDAGPRTRCASRLSCRTLASTEANTCGWTRRYGAWLGEIGRPGPTISTLRSAHATRRGKTLLRQCFFVCHSTNLSLLSSKSTANALSATLAFGGPRPSSTCLVQSQTLRPGTRRCVHFCTCTLPLHTKPWTLKGGHHVAAQGVRNAFLELHKHTPGVHFNIGGWHASDLRNATFCLAPRCSNVPWFISSLA